MIGFSHGAYIAYMASKISPSNVDVIIDNSAYLQANYNYLALGKELDYIGFQEACNFEKNLEIHFYTKTFWTSNSYAKNHFSNDAKQIRQIFNKEHLKTQSKIKKQKIIIYHSVYDGIASFFEKKEFVGYLKDLGYELEFNEISSLSQVDGKLIKNLNHSMNMSLKKLIEKELEPLLEGLEDIKNSHSVTSVSYNCENLIYHFKQENDTIKLFIQKTQI